MSSSKGEAAATATMAETTRRTTLISIASLGLAVAEVSRDPLQGGGLFGRWTDGERSKSSSFIQLY